MHYEIQNAPVFTVIEFALDEADEVVAQPDSMLTMTAGIQVTGSVNDVGTNRKWWSGVKSWLGGESFFRAVFRAKRDGQSLLLAPGNYGDIRPVSVADQGPLFLTRGSYLAHVGPCALKVRYGGIKGWVSKTGVFLLHVSGGGTVFLQTFGSIMERSLGEGEKFFIDNRYVVAFSESVQYQVVKSSTTVRDSLMSGEAFVNRFTGPGTLYYQTRTKPSTGFLGTLLGAMT